MRCRNRRIGHIHTSKSVLDRKALFLRTAGMDMMAPVEELDGFSFHDAIIQQGELISDRLNMLRIEHYPPDATKTLRQFSLAEVAYFLGVTQSNVKKLHLEGRGPTPTTSA